MNTPDHNSAAVPAQLDRRFLLGGLAGAAGVAALAGITRAGPLTPPAGAVSSSGRTLDEIYNRIPVDGTDRRAVIAGGVAVSIGTPGSYVLGGGIEGSGNLITIATSNITLDLNGFTVRSTSNTSNVIQLSAGVSNVTIRNGRLVNGFHGVSSSGAVSNITIEDLSISNTHFNGVNFPFNGVRASLVRRCHIFNPGGGTTGSDSNSSIAGFNIGGGANRIEDCVVANPVFNGTGTPTFRGAFFLSTAGNGGVANVVARCTFTSTSPLTASAIDFDGTGVYRDNTAINFNSGYLGGSNGGGNI